MKFLKTLAPVLIGGLILSYGIPAILRKFSSTATVNEA